MSTAVHDWFAARVPAEWPARGVEVMADQDEIMVIVDLIDEEGREAGGPAGSDGSDGAEVSDGSEPTRKGSAATAPPSGLTGIRRFREATRDERMALARAAEQAFDQKVSWGARLGDTVVVFTTTSVPVMTRLRLTERRVLDTLIDAGVARSRSEALAWCVRLVGENEGEWIHELRRAFEAVEAARASGPRSRTRSRPKGESGGKAC